MELWLPGVLILLALIFVGMPIAYAMLLVGFGGLLLLYDFDVAMVLSLTADMAFETGMNYGLSVIPLFIIMGNLVTVSRLSENLYDACHKWMGHYRGGLALATTASCAAFSAVCGSSLATAATMSKIALPQMRRYGYADSLSTGTIAAGGTLGILIPPSTILILYGILTSTNIGKLFIAGILPGLVGMLGYMLAVKYTVWRRPEAGPPAPKHSLRERLVATRGVLGISGLFVLIIGGIYAGMFTPTEAAGIGASGALVMALMRRTLTWSKLLGVLKESARTTTSLFFIMIGALMFNMFVDFAGLTKDIQGLLRGSDLSPTAVILLLIGVYLVLATILESISMILLTVPVLYPLIGDLGFIDPALGPEAALIWFGIFVVVVTEISLIVPPVGLNIFVLKSVVRDVEMGTIFRGLIPFIVSDVVRLLLVTFVPMLVLIVPLML